MKDWQQELIEKPSKYILRNFSMDEWREIVLTELFEPNKHFNPFPNGLPDDVRKKISDSLKGHIVSHETRRKLSIAHTGKKQSKDTIEKRRKSNAGFRHSDLSKEKMRQLALGRVHSNETRQKISLAGRGAIRSKDFKENLKRVVSGRIHVTNGQINKFVFPDCIPIGFHRGRTL
jgi:hypothetical protein